MGRWVDGWVGRWVGGGRLEKETDKETTGKSRKTIEQGTYTYRLDS